jgi:hypothetical protein
MFIHPRPAAGSEHDIPLAKTATETVDFLVSGHNGMMNRDLFSRCLNILTISTMLACDEY